MKTHKLLFSKITNFANLVSAYNQARVGKRNRASVSRFDYLADLNLLNLKSYLTSNSYRPGKYRHFWICDPKKRQISAPVFVDRIVHHALYQVIEPIFDHGFIYDSYACRRGKGNHQAMKRLQTFLRRPGTACALKGDISKYFASINQQILFQLIKKKIADPKVLALLQIIIFSYQNPVRQDPNNPKGIPIGNLTSQLFANIYLNELDHYVKQILKRKYYLRYVDDFIILGESKNDLKRVYQAITQFLKDRLGLELHPKKVRIFPTRLGVDFVGYVVFPDHIRLRSKNVRRFRKRFKKLLQKQKEGQISPEELFNRTQSWVAHAKHADTFRLRQKLFSSTLPAFSPIHQLSLGNIHTACETKTAKDRLPAKAPAKPQFRHQAGPKSSSVQLDLFDCLPE
jgi:RNA-directed DNA polymerase